MVNSLSIFKSQPYEECLLITNIGENVKIGRNNGFLFLWILPPNSWRFSGVPEVRTSLFLFPSLFPSLILSLPPPAPRHMHRHTQIEWPTHVWERLWHYSYPPGFLCASCFFLVLWYQVVEALTCWSRLVLEGERERDLRLQ